MGELLSTRNTTPITSEINIPYVNKYITNF